MTLKDVKVNDTVLEWAGREWRERKVKRITKTMIVVGNESWETRYRKADGRIVGKEYSYNIIKAVTWNELKEHRTRCAEERELRELRIEVQNIMRELPRYRNMNKQQCEALIEAAKKVMGE